jgi:hypothetical protein
MRLLLIIVPPHRAFSHVRNARMTFCSSLDYSRVPRSRLPCIPGGASRLFTLLYICAYLHCLDGAMVVHRMTNSLHPTQVPYEYERKKIN